MQAVIAFPSPPVRQPPSAAPPRFSPTGPVACKTRLHPGNPPLLSGRVEHPFMKTVPALLALATLLTASVSCDKHSWEETQVLHEGMHKEGHGEAKKDDHAKPAAHAPAAHAPAAPAAHAPEAKPAAH